MSSHVIAQCNPIPNFLLAKFSSCQSWQVRCDGEIGACPNFRPQDPRAIEPQDGMKFRRGRAGAPHPPPAQPRFLRFPPAFCLMRPMRPIARSTQRRPTARAPSQRTQGAPFTSNSGAKLANLKTLPTLSTWQQTTASALFHWRLACRVTQSYNATQSQIFNWPSFPVARVGKCVATAKSGPVPISTVSRPHPVSCVLCVPCVLAAR